MSGGSFTFAPPPPPNSPLMKPCWKLGWSVDIFMVNLLQKAAKYDKDLDKEVRQWLSEVTGEPFPDDTGKVESDTFWKALKDGVYLCKAMNAIQPGSVKKINTSTMAFKQVHVGDLVLSTL